MADQCWYGTQLAALSIGVAVVGKWGFGYGLLIGVALAVVAFFVFVTIVTELQRKVEHLREQERRCGLAPRRVTGS